MPTPGARAAPAPGPEQDPGPEQAATVVLGIGNTLLSDEGFGVHVVESLRAAGGWDARVALLDGGTLSFTLAPAIEDARHLVVVDAAELGAEPGTLRVFEDQAMDDFLGAKRRRSVHEVGLLDLLAMASLAGRLPERRALVAVQPQCLSWGDAPCAPVAAAIPAACRAVRELLAGWES